MRHRALVIGALLVGRLLWQAAPTNGAGCTVAGGGHGDGLAAKDQALRPVSVGSDTAGNVFVFDSLYGPIRRVDGGTGQLSTLGAGFPYQATTGFGTPYSGVALDGQGTLYVAHEVVRRFEASTNQYVTVAGKTVVGADNFTFCGDDAPATDVCMRAADVVVDANGDLFIADDWNQRIWRVDAATGTASTIAGGFSGPCDGNDGPALAVCVRPTQLALDGGGNLFFYDESAERVRRLDRNTQMVTVVAGNGTWGECPDGASATGACIPCPAAIAVDHDGNLYFTTAHGTVAPGTERTEYPIRRVDALSGDLSTVGHVSGAVTPLGLSCAGRYDPFDLSIAPDGTLLVAAATEGRVFRFDLGTSDVTPVAGNSTVEYPLCGDGGAATNACLGPLAIATDAGGAIFVGERTDARHEPRGLGRIRRVDPTTGIITTITGDGVAPFCPGGQPCLGAPSALATDDGGLIIADASRGMVRRLDLASGTLSTLLGGGSTACIDNRQVTPPTECVAAIGFARDHNGDLLVVDQIDRRILRLAAGSNAISQVAELPEDIVRGDRASIGVDTDGTLFVGDAGYTLGYHAGGGIFRVDGGTFTRLAGRTEWETRGGFGCPQIGLALAACVFPHQVLVNPADGTLLFAGSQLARLDANAVIYRIDTDTPCAGDVAPFFTSFVLATDGSVVLGSSDRVQRLPADTVRCRAARCELDFLDSGAVCGAVSPSARTEAWLTNGVLRLRTLLDATDRPDRARRRAARLAKRLARHARRDRSTAADCRRALRTALIDLRRAIRAEP